MSMSMSMLYEGLLGYLIWQVYTTYISPVELRPEQLVKNVFGIESDLLANMVHFLTAVVVYPVLWMILERMVPGVKEFAWVIRILVLGILTWFLAIGVFSPLAGGAFMAGWSSLTWASLGGHILYSMPITV